MPTISRISTGRRCRARRARARAAPNPIAVSIAATGVRKRANAPGRQLGALANGGDRRHARRAERREEARDQRHDDPQRERDDDRPRLEQEAVVRQREADRVEEREDSPFASARPRKRPTIDAITPIASASTTTDIRTWRRDAPSVRSVASSRVRCAIVIESELTITKAPTKSAMQPEREQEVAQERDELVRVLGVLLAPARRRSCTCCPGRQDRLDLRQEPLRARRPGFAATRIWSSLPSLSKSRCAVARSNPASVAPPIELTEPNLTSPEIRSCLDRAFDLDADLVADLRCPSCRRSTCRSTTSFAPGPLALHEGEAVELRLRRVDQKPRFGAPPNAIALPSVDELRVLARDAADRVLDVGQRLHLGEQRLVEGGARSSRCRSRVEGATSPVIDGVGVAVDVA